jgi:hypothetical protein
MGEDEPRIPQQQAWYQAMATEADVGPALRHFVAGVGEITRRVAPLSLVAQVAADGDPDTARVMAFHERWRVDGYQEVVKLISDKAPLRPGLSVERATDLLLLHLGPDVYRFLVEGRGWSHDEWLAWTTALLTEELFGDKPAPGQGR